MAEGRFIHQINDNKPVSINIEFNINGHPSKPEVSIPNLKNKKITIDSSLNKTANCVCQPSRTPELSHTDRNTYSKQMDYLKPMEETKVKKKRKRNSMDINVGFASKSIEKDCERSAKHSRGHTLNLIKKSQLTIKQQQFKKKRTFSKYQVDSYKKTYLQAHASKSASVDPSKTQRKSVFHKSLKNIIHKLVNNQLSKRSLFSNTFLSKGKSFNLNSINCNFAKKSKKKSKTERESVKKDLQQTIFNREAIVEKLTSIKSMNNSILKSEEYDDNQNIYFPKKNERINIKTDQSFQLIDEIIYYERKVQKDEKKKEKQSIINKVALNETNKIIENYLKIINQYAEEDDVHSNQNHEQPYGNLAKQVNNLLNNEYQNHQTQEIFAEIAKTVLQSQQNVQHSSQNQSKRQKFNDSAQLIKKRKEQEINQQPFIISEQKIRPFRSSEINRQQNNLNSQIERQKLQELKKQQIQKWGYLLQFIKKNINGQSLQTQQVLSQVYLYLQKSKNDLQDEHSQSTTNKKINPKELDQFTVKLSEKKQQSDNKQYYKQQKKIKNQEDVLSFQEDQTEQNEDLKMMNFQTISQALRMRHQSLIKKQSKELSALQNKRQGGKITEEQYNNQKIKIQKWIKNELNEIQKAKKNIWKGYHQAKGILDKTANSKYYEEYQSSSSKKMMKCLSESYLKKTQLQYKRILGSQTRKKSKNNSGPSESEQSVKQQSLTKYKQKYIEKEYQNDFNEYNHKFKSIQHDDFNNEEQEESQQNYQQGNESESEGASKSQDMDAIKQRLLQMKKQHFSGQQQNPSSPSISYEEVERQLEDSGYSDEQMAIINQQMANDSGNFSALKNNLQNKLKYLCPEDKEDIFEFIFLDLCIELYQEHCKDNKIMRSISGYVSKVQALAKKKKGVKTNLNVVKQYMKRFVSFIIRTNKSSLNNMNFPMGPTALQMLRYMHQVEYEINEEEQEVPTLIIPVGVFQKFQKSILPTIQFQQYYEDQQKQQARVQFLKTVLHIHNKALFDSLNQFLDQQRPFGIWGKPFPWKKSSTFIHKYSETQKQDRLKKSMDKVIEQCSYVCGLLVDKQQSLVGTAKLSQAYIQQIKEDRLSRMLANDLVQNEERWLFYDDEETEVLVEIGTYIYNMLINQARNQIWNIQNEKNRI